MTIGAASANCLTSISMRYIIRLAGSTMLDVQGKSHTDTERRATVYQMTDRLRDRRTVFVSADEIVTTVSAWLDELGAASPLVEDLAHALRAGDWPKAHALGDYLSVEVAVAADTQWG
jgi:hypothetical protein